MPHLIYSDQAIIDLGRLRAFLQPKNPQAAGRASRAILAHLDILQATPEIGRLLDDGIRREFVIPFADAGYIALYEYDREAEIVVVQAIRHQREL